MWVKYSIGVSLTRIGGTSMDKSEDITCLWSLESWTDMKKVTQNTKGNENV